MSKWKTATLSSKFNEEHWDKLQIYMKLPWYKRLFRRIPK